MAEVIELLPVTRIVGGAGERWLQPTDSVVDVSAYTDAVVVAVVHSLEVGSRGSVTLGLQTALANRDEHFLAPVTLASWSANPADYPVHEHKLLCGSSSGSSDAPGFVRFLRVTATGTAVWHITVGVRVLLKP